MSGIDKLMPQFDEPGLPPETHQKFKDLALNLANLQHPMNVRFVSKLLMVRKLYARLNPTN